MWENQAFPSLLLHKTGSLTGTFQIVFTVEEEENGTSGGITTPAAPAAAVHSESTTAGVGAGAAAGAAPHVVHVEIQKQEQIVGSDGVAVEAAASLLALGPPQLSKSGGERIRLLSVHIVYTVCRNRYHSAPPLVFVSRQRYSSTPSNADVYPVMMTCIGTGGGGGGGGRKKKKAVKGECEKKVCVLICMLLSHSIIIII